MNKINEETVSNCCGAGCEHERCSACKEGCSMQVLEAEYKIDNNVVRVNFDDSGDITDIAIYDEYNNIILNGTVSEAKLLNNLLNIIFEEFSLEK